MTSNEIQISKAQRCPGSIEISGAKNAALPLMAACLLTDKEVVLENVPKITDVDEMKKQLESYRVRVTSKDASRWALQAARETTFTPKSRDGSNTRGSFLVLGPLLARFKAAKVYKPGGCKIGGDKGRPVDYHIDALKRMGATVEEDTVYFFLKADQGLHGTQIDCKHSVGTTETVIMAACLADGRTVITNAAVEPEIMDLIKLLKAMGMTEKIRVHESEKKIDITGSSSDLLNGCTQAHKVIPDRIEAGTWAIAAAMTGGSLLLEMDPGVGRKIMEPVIQKLEQTGVDLQWRPTGLQVQRHGKILPVKVTTGPFPEFPTDLLPQWVTFMTQASDPSVLEDTIYDNRFNHVQYLQKMGAKFTKYSDRKYQVHGNAKLTGTRVKATDLRAGAALILAALVAEGHTVVKEFHHVLRGYENIREKLGRWNVQFRSLPQARAGFHGGTSNQVQQMGLSRHDRQRR